MREKRKERGQPWRRARATFGLAVALVWLLGQGVGLGSDGTLFGPPFSLLTMGAEAIFSGVSATYDPVKERFLVVWSDSFTGVLYGRQVNADGTLFPDREQPIASRPSEWSPSVTYDPVNRRFLVVWTRRDRSVCSSSPNLHGLLMADLPVEGSRLEVSPKKLSFSRAQVGSTKSRSLVLKNGGQGGLYGSVGMIDGPFEVISGGGDFTLEPGESKTVTIQFAPTDSGKVTSVLEITSTDPKRMSIQVQIGGTVK